MNTQLSEVAAKNLSSGENDKFVTPSFKPLKTLTNFMVAKSHNKTGASGTFELIVPNYPDATKRPDGDTAKAVIGIS
jgi:hypothetical protein